MHKIDQAAGQVVAADTQASVAAVDEAVISFSRLCASIVEVSGSAKLPVSTLQKALSSAANGMLAAVHSREEITNATRELLKVQNASTLRTTAFGCPGGLFGTALHETSEQAMVETTL